MSLLPQTPGSLLERTRNLAVLSEDDLRRFAAQACRDRDVEALWALLEAHLTLHGSSGSRVSLHTLSAYKRGLKDLLQAWQGENLLRPGKNAGVLYVRELERIPLDRRTGYLLPSRSRIVVYKRLESACRQARVRFKGVHALRHASGTRLLDDTGDITLTADHLRHSSLDTARGYAKCSNKELKKAVAGW